MHEGAVHSPDWHPPFFLTVVLTALQKVTLVVSLSHEVPLSCSNHKIPVVEILLLSRYTALATAIQSSPEIDHRAAFLLQS